MTTHLDRLTSEFNDDPAHAWHVFGPALIAVVRAADDVNKFERFMPDDVDRGDASMKLDEALTALDAAIEQELGTKETT